MAMQPCYDLCVCRSMTVTHLCSMVYLLDSYSFNVCLLQGLIASVFGLLCLSLRICFSVFVAQRDKSGYVAETDTSPARQPRLVRWLYVCMHTIVTCCMDTGCYIDTQSSYPPIGTITELDIIQLTLVLMHFTSRLLYCRWRCSHCV